MLTAIAPIQQSLARQLNHWQQAAVKLSAVENLVSANAWHGIDRSIGLILKTLVQQSNDVVDLASTLQKQLENANNTDALRAIKKGLLQLRNDYLRVEETIHFYTVAVNSRATANTAALLRACDIICTRSMEALLQPLGKEIPAVLTYVDKGIGASILKAGLTLWHGKPSPMAAIKVTQHNLLRPTAIIHETGHQVAHILNWVDELSNNLSKNLSQHSKLVATAFSNWASEIAADAYAFVHTGFAAVASLHDVISGMPNTVFSYQPHDPHPISYIRVLLNVEMCRLFYGPGPWDDLAAAFKHDYDINLVNASSTGLIKMTVDALPDVVKIVLKDPYPAFGNRSLTQLIDPQKASPRDLEKLEYMAGPALFTSHAWIWRECIRLLALNGYKVGIGMGNLAALYKQQEEWMIRLGFSVDLN